MKRFITILIIFLTGSGLFATGLGNPNLHLTDDTVNLSGNLTQVLSNVNHISYIGTDSVELKWEVIQFDVPASWDLGFCDRSQCNTITGSSTRTFWLPAGISSIMNLDVNPNNNTGSGTVRIAVYPVGGNVSDGVIITYNISVTPVGVKSAAAVNFTMYPNPVKDYLNINFSRKGLQHIEIYNILGNKILVKDIANADFVRIPFLNYQRGRYIVMYRSENGKIITKSVSKE